MKYELTVLLHPDLEIDLDQPINKIKKLITDADGEVLRHDNWGKRRTAYPVKGENHAVYSFFLVELPPQAVHKIQEAMRISDEILRYLLVKHEKPPKKDEDKDKAEKDEGVSSDTETEEDNKDEEE